MHSLSEDQKRGSLKSNGRMFKFVFASLCLTIALVILAVIVDGRPNSGCEHESNSTTEAEITAANTSTTSLPGTKKPVVNREISNRSASVFVDKGNNWIGML